MIHRLCLALVSTLMLSACSSLGGLFTYEDPPPPAPMAVAAASVPAPDADEARCQRVAASDRIRAQASGYDPATLDRMTLTSYQQCRLLVVQ